MRETVGIARPAQGSDAVARRVEVWNRRLLIAASMLIMWSASVLALQAAGPDICAMFAGEGMLVSEAE